jgi:hypothetical protein
MVMEGRIGRGKARIHHTGCCCARAAFPGSGECARLAASTLEKKRQFLAKLSDTWYCFSENMTSRVVVINANARPGDLGVKDRK